MCRASMVGVEEQVIQTEMLAWEIEIVRGLKLGVRGTHSRSVPCFGVRCGNIIEMAS